MDQDNLDAEQSVGLIKDELSKGGTTQSSTASSTQVKCAAHDLMDILL